MSSTGRRRVEDLGCRPPLPLLLSAYARFWICFRTPTLDVSSFFVGGFLSFGSSFSVVLIGGGVSFNGMPKQSSVATGFAGPYIRNSLLDG